MSKRSSGAAMSYAYSVAQIVVSLLYVPLLLGAIGASEYGLYQMIGSIIAYLAVINNTLSAGASRFYCRYFAVGDEEGMANVLGTLRRIYRVAGLVIAIVTVVLAGVLRVVYAQSLTPWELDESCILLGILLVNLLLTMYNTLAVAVITAHEEFTFLKGTQLAVLLVQPVAILAIVQSQPYAWVVCAVQLACNAVCVIAQHRFARVKLGMDDRLRTFSKDLERDLIRFSGAIVLAAVADQVFWKTDQLILGWLYGTSVVAVYAVGAQIVMSYMPLGSTVSSVFLPKASELWHRDHDIGALSDLFTRVGRISLYPLLLVLTGFIVFGRDFIALWAGQGFEEAYWVAVIVMVPFTIDICQHVGLTILQVVDKYGFRGRMYLAAALLNILLTFVLASLYGCVGAASSTAIAMFASSGLIMNWYYWKRVGLDVPAFWRSVLGQIVPSVVLCAAGLAIWGMLGLRPGWATLVAGIACYTLAYMVIMWLVASNDYERSLVRRLLRRGK